MRCYIHIFKRGEARGRCLTALAGKSLQKGFPLCRKLVGFSSPSLFDK